MTMLDDNAEGAAEVAVKLVKLTANDWRKLAMFLIALSFGGALIAYQLVASVVNSEVDALRATDTRATIRADAVEIRVKKLEDMQTDFAVLKNDVSWIRQELERQARESASKRNP
jgi:hypothetical protein